MLANALSNIMLQENILGGITAHSPWGTGHMGLGWTKSVSQSKPVLVFLSHCFLTLLSHPTTRLWSVCRYVLVVGRGVLLSEGARGGRAGLKNINHDMWKVSNGRNALLPGGNTEHSQEDRESKSALLFSGEGWHSCQLEGRKASRH